MKQHRGKKVILCALLSMVVHIGLAAAFVSAIQTEQTARPQFESIQVTLTREVRDSADVSSKKSDSSNELSGSNEDLSSQLESLNHSFDETASQLIDVKHPPPNPADAEDQALAASPGSEFKDNNYEPSQVHDAVSSPLDSAEITPVEIDLVQADFTFRDFPGETEHPDSLIEPAVVDIDPVESISQTTAIEVQPKTNWESWALPSKEELEEKYASFETSLHHNTWITNPASSAVTRLTNTDFDSEFERMSQPEQEMTAIIQSSSKSKLAAKTDTDYFAVTTDADQISGISPMAEIESVITDTGISPNNQSVTEEPIVDKSVAQLASTADVAEQFQKLLPVESDEIELNNSFVSQVQSVPFEPEDSTVEEAHMDTEIALKSETTQQPVEIDDQITEADDSAISQLESLNQDILQSQTALDLQDSADDQQLNKHLDLPEPDKIRNLQTESQLAAIDLTPAQPSQPEKMIGPKSNQQASLGIDSLNVAPKYDVEGLANPAPRYPYLSRINDEQGKVTLQVVVDRKGKAIKVTILESSGYSRLDKAARKAIKRWKFLPAEKNGVVTQGVVEIPVSFVLEET